MERLRDRMLEEMKLRNLSPRTIKVYMSNVEAFSKYFGKSPALMGEEKIREYLRYLREEKKLSWSSINVAHNAMRFFYTKTLRRAYCVENIPRSKKEKKLPIVLSKTEVISMLESCRNLKYKTILMAVYSTGCRLSEVTHLKVTDVDSARMTVRIEQGKGKKDRYTTLSEKLLITLREYWRRYRPETYLFTAYDKNRPLGVSVIQREFQDAKKKPAY